MASIEKIIQKMKNQPHGISQEEAGKVLAAKGYRLDRQRGSHCQYINENGGRLTIVVKNPAIKRAYVEAILERIGEK